MSRNSQHYSLDNIMNIWILYVKELTTLFIRQYNECLINYCNRTTFSQSHVLDYVKQKHAQNDGALIKLFKLAVRVHTLAHTFLPNYPTYLFSPLSTFPG